jgi:3-oxoacyl-[acyl-carrier-protein] synthase II
MTQKVYVTGMAIWSPYGRGLENFWTGLAENRSASSIVERFPVEHWVYRTKHAALIADIGSETKEQDEENWRRVLRVVVEDLITSAGVSRDEVSPYDVAVVLGSSQAASRPFRELLRVRRKELPATNLRVPLGMSSGAIVREVAKYFDARGPSTLVSTACSSGTSSIGLAYDYLRLGRARRAIAGGIGYFTAISFSGFNILRLTGRQGCRPFDSARDGMMLGDGFALVMLETEELVQARRAKSMARIIGYSSGNEAYHPTAPEPEGKTTFRVMWEALSCSNEQLCRLDYINAHGTGTPANDKAELNAIRRLLAMRTERSAVAISSTKGHHGHSLGATGSVEFVATVLAIQRGAAPANYGLENTEPGFEDLDLVHGQSQAREIRVALSNSLAFGGNVASIALEAVRI